MHALSKSLQDPSWSELFNAYMWYYRKEKELLYRISLFKRRKNISRRWSNVFNSEFYYFMFFIYYYLFTAIGFATGGSSPTLVHAKTIKQHCTVVQHNTVKRKQHNTIKRKHTIIRTQYNKHTIIHTKNKIHTQYNKIQ
jgi:hypothetical protein